MTISAAVLNLQAKLRALGIQNAPDAVPESANAFPFGVSYLNKGNLEIEAGWFKHIHTIFTEIHVSRNLLPAAIDKAVSYIEPFFTAVSDDPTLGGSVATIIEVRYTFGRLEWGGVETFGERFEIDVKLMS